MGVIVVLDSCKFHLITVHDNLMQDPSNNKSIILAKMKFKMNKNRNNSILNGSKNQFSDYSVSRPLNNNIKTELIA